jgi:hypothetical protein
LAENCTLKTGTFPTPTGAGKIINCIDSTGNVINSTKVSVADGVNAKDAVNKGQLDALNSYSGTNYLMVYGTGTPAENGAELQAVYNAAKAMSPSATNVITIAVAPGNYNLNTYIKFDTSYINVVSLTGNADVIIEGVMTSVGQYSYFRGIISDNFPMVLNSPNIILENCILNGIWDGAGNSSNPINSTFINCNIKGKVGTDGGTLAEKLINCTIGTIDTGGGTFTGLAENCTLKTGTFPTPTGAGKIINCVDSTGNVVNSYATYADESAATIAGLSSGTIYKTPTGELRIKL